MLFEWGKGGCRRMLTLDFSKFLQRRQEFCLLHASDPLVAITPFGVLLASQLTAGRTRAHDAHRGGETPRFLVGRPGGDLHHRR